MKHKFMFVCLCIISFVNVNAQSNTIGPGIALEFDGGTGKFVTLGDNFNTLAFPFCIEAWVYPTSAPPNRGGIFGSDNDLINYRGFWLRVTNSLTVDFEFGDGSGSGSTDRRGFVTTDVIKLNQWTHIAAVANSVTDVSIYFNGKLAGKVSSGGTATVASLLHSSAGASFGWTENMHEEFAFPGKLDEVRLWNISRSESEIRSTMCHKLLGTESGMIGYWNADESYVSTSVNDLTSPAENGTITGAVNKITSSAPIGDVSTNQYVVDWSGVTLSLNSPGGDKLKINKILNSPFGVHLYRVNSGPYYFDGLAGYTNYYYGVFTINGAIEAKYTATYIYSLSNGVTTVDNEINSKLSIRNNASVLSWSDAGATLNTTGNKLTRKNVTSMKEFIYNNVIQGGDRFSYLSIVEDVTIFPNPSRGGISLTNIDPNDRILITDLTGNKIVDEISSINSDFYSINLESIPSGVYLVNIFKQNGTIVSNKLIITN